MSLIKLLIFLGIGFVVLIFLLFPKSRVLFSGFMNLFFDNMAATPDGAAAIYSKHIDDAREIYENSKNTHRQAKGKKIATFNEIEKLQKEISAVEKKCNDLAAKGDRESLIVMAQQRQSLATRIADLQDAYDKYSALENKTRLMFEEAEADLNRLKEEKESTVNRMKQNKDIKELYDQVDRLQGNSAKDKLLDAIRDKDKELEEVALGAQAIHQDKLSTKMQIAEKKTADLDTLNYVDSLMSKYNNKKPQLRG